MHCHERFCLSIKIHAYPNPKQAIERLATIKRIAACFQFRLVLSLFCTLRCHTCIPRVCPVFVQKYPKNNSRDDNRVSVRNGSLELVPDSLSALYSSAPTIE